MKIISTAHFSYVLVCDENFIVCAWEIKGAGCLVLKQIF